MQLPNVSVYASHLDALNSKSKSEVLLSVTCGGVEVWRNGFEIITAFFEQSKREEKTCRLLQLRSDFRQLHPT